MADHLAEWLSRYPVLIAKVRDSWLLDRYFRHARPPSKKEVIPEWEELRSRLDDSPPP
jgi:hypothetical protein